MNAGQIMVAMALSAVAGAAFGISVCACRGKQGRAAFLIHATLGGGGTLLLEIGIIVVVLVAQIMA